MPLVMFDLLDRHTISLSGHLHFTDEGIFIVNRTMCTEDALCTQPNLARLVCTLQVPENPFQYIAAPPPNLPL